MTLPRLPGPPEKDLAPQINLEFCMWIQEHFDEIIQHLNDEIIQDLNNDSLRTTKSPLGDLR